MESIVIAPAELKKEMMSRPPLFEWSTPPLRLRPVQLPLKHDDRPANLIDRIRFVTISCFASADGEGDEGGWGRGLLHPPIPIRAHYNRCQILSQIGLRRANKHEIRSCQLTWNVPYVTSGYREAGWNGSETICIGVPDVTRK